MLISRTPFPTRKLTLKLALLGVVGYVGQSLAYFIAIRVAPASLIALLLYTSPVFVTLGAALFLKERITRTKALALAVALTGAVLTVTAGVSLDTGGTAGGSSGLYTGILLGIVASVVGAGYTLFGSQVLRSVSTIPATTIIITSTAVVYGIMAFSQGLVLPQTATGYLAILALSTISTVFSVGLFMAGLQRVGPANASTMGVLEPVFAVLLAALILGETLYPAQIIGGVMIGAGVVIISRTV